MRVRVGQRVAIGETVGRCGNPDNSTEPHMHLRAVDTPDIDRAPAIPFTLAGTLPRNGAVVESVG